ncbi:MAG TPA: monovalent cation/H(+) antiporter subunit G, partial [Thermomicrobiales bacterium]|nr:monovalent cation/H(+) antiporter subunit G [Thermomicrobiales bacterium]
MTPSFDALAPWIADALVLLGVTVMTIGMYGIYRMPDLYTRLHAASKSAFLGVISLAVASMFAGQAAITERAILIGVLLLLTTPVSAHVIARAAYLDGQRDEPHRDMAAGSRESWVGERGKG